MQIGKIIGLILLLSSCIFILHYISAFIIYKINENLLISTGYSPFGNIRIDYKKTRKTEEKARAIVHDTKLSFEQKKKKLDNLLNKYIQEALKEIEQ